MHKAERPIKSIKNTLLITGLIVYFIVTVNFKQNEMTFTS